MRILIINFIISISFSHSVLGQDDLYYTFKDTRIINTNSVETLKKGSMDFRVTHRFGDLAGDRGGWPTFFGMENASDIMFGLEYGLSDRVTIGLNRTKGSGELRRMVNGLIKVKLVSQNEDGSTPFTITAAGLLTLTTMDKSDDPSQLNFFPEFYHRTITHTELMFSRKFGSTFSIQLTPALTHRNLAAYQEENDIFSLGLATRIQLSKVFGIIFDGTYVISDLLTTENGYYLPWGVGLEMDTGGHVFQVNFTNATGITPTDYIPYTTSSWSKGEFRLGFTISRRFNI